MHGSVRPRSRGFTMVELAVSITIVAILAAIAVPSFRAAGLSSQLRSTANGLLAATRLARSEAIRRNSPVTLCASAGGAACEDVAWNQGWVLVNSTGTVLFKQGPAPANLQVTEGSGQTALVFPAWGAGTTPASFTICRSSPEAGAEERVVSVEASGRAAVRRTTDGACP